MEFETSALQRHSTSPVIMHVLPSSLPLFLCLDLTMCWSLLPLLPASPETKRRRRIVRQGSDPPPALFQNRWHRLSYEADPHHTMANPTQPGLEVLSKEFKRDDNDAVLCTDKVEIEVSKVEIEVSSHRGVNICF